MIAGRAAVRRDTGCGDAHRHRAAQAGEFGFVLLNLILDRHLVDSTLLQAILASMLLSMLAAPF